MNKKSIIVAFFQLSAATMALSQTAPWMEWKERWQEVQQNVQRSWQGKKEECSEKMHSYWSESRDDWKSGWNEVKTSPKEIWRNQIDPLETYTEEVVQAAENPETCKRITSVALSGNGKTLVAEKLRFVPVYDPYTRNIRTLDAIAQDAASNRSGYLEGSAFADDPAAACALTIMLDTNFLWNSKILRTESGEWISAKEALADSAHKAVGQELISLQEQAQKAMIAGDSDQSARLLSQFSNVTMESNRKATGVTSGENPSNVMKALSNNSAKQPAPIVAQLEGEPAELLRNAKALQHVGKSYRATQNYQRLLDQYPHSGFADDALLRLAEDDYTNLKYDECINKLHTLLERYYRSDYCDNALYILGNCYLAKVNPTDDQRIAAVRNYRQILSEYEVDSTNWKAEVVWLVVNKEKATQCYRLLVQSFPDSPYTSEATMKLAKLEDN